MKKIININLSARLIPIEDSAYDMLKVYLESLKKYFDKEAGKEEIISDIESRIAELFQERLAAGAHCITDEDVTKIIASIGRPEDLDAEENAGNYSGNYYNEPQQTNTSHVAEDAAFNQGFQEENTASGAQTAAAKDNYRDRLFRNSNDSLVAGVCSGIAHKLKLDPTLVRILYVLLIIGSVGFALLIYLILAIFLPAAPLKPNLKRRLFRSMDNKMIAGVCGGLSAYLKLDIWLVRLFFSFTLLLQIIFSIFGGGGRLIGINAPAIIFGSFTITFAVIYLILWILIPEAKSRSEKLQMQGKKVDLENIKNTVHEELNSGKEEGSEKISYSGSNFFSAVGKILKTLLLLLVALIVAGLVIMLIIAIGFGWAVTPYMGYFVTQSTDTALFWAGILFLFGVSVLAMALWIIRVLTGRKKPNRYLSYLFAILWVIGLVCTILFIVNIGSGYSTKVNVETIVPVTQPGNHRMVIVANDFNNINLQNNQSGNHTDGNERAENGYTIDSTGKKVKVYGSVRSRSKTVVTSNFIFKNSNFRIQEDSIVYKALNFKISRSKDSLFYLITNSSSRGSTAATAADRAHAINAAVYQTDSTLYLTSTITLKEGDKFRMQQIVYNLQVPIGGKVLIDRSVTRNSIDFSDRIWDDDLLFDTNWNDYSFRQQLQYSRWRPGIEYVMTEKGLQKTGN